MHTKLLPLKEAVSALVKPGMKVHIAGGMGGAGAAVCEIIRQFYGKNPGFELIQSTVAAHSINLLHCNLVEKMTFTVCVDVSTSGRPSKVMQKKWAAKTIKFENWSLLSLQQRLMAGAMGIPFMPTRSISGTTMSIANQDSFREIADPFQRGNRAGLLEALNPDISLIHGCAADEDGNTILAVPYGDDIWGSLASSQGVLVTVEKILPPDVIRQYSALVKIPGHLVKSVSVVPMGVHPFSMANPGITGVSAYESDVEFLQRLHQASLNSEKLDTWIKEWVLDCTKPEDYLNKLGKRKIASLQYTGRQAAITDDAPAPSSITGAAAFNREEMVLVAASREIINSVLRSQHRVVLMGAGSRSIAALMANHQLRNQGVGFQIATGNGQYGYNPSPSELGLQSLGGAYSSKMLTDTVTSLGVIIGGKYNQCLGVLGAGQIDKYGNINSTVTSSGEFLVGTGGANDVGNAREVIVILNQSKDRFVEKLPYISCPGTRVATVVSTLGIFTKPPGKEELHLAACMPDSQLPDLGARVRRIQKECGWPLQLANHIEDIPQPTLEELAWLRRLVVPG